LNRLQRFAYHPNFWIVIVVERIFLLVGSILILVFAIAYLDNLLFLAKSKSVQGTIIELVPKPNDSSERYFLKVAFRGEITKRRYEFISSLSFNKTAYNEDERIKVFYDPKNPENARIRDFEELFAIPTIILLSGAFLFVIGFLLIRTRHKIMRQIDAALG
jgi:hypothetical protein